MTAKHMEEIDEILGNKPAAEANAGRFVKNLTSPL